MTRLDLSGAWPAHVAVDDLHQHFVDPAFDDADWEPLTVPGHWRSHAAFATTDGPVLYRRRFDAPALAPGRRAFLVFGGIFYYADVWLDADYLGATDGYFTRHAFEVTPHVHDRTEHVLAVEVACPRQHERTRKQLVTGVFSQWDNLDPDWNPGGLWRPAGLVETGPVRLVRVRVLCTEASETLGRLLLDLSLDAGPEAPPGPVELTATITGSGGELLAEATRGVTPATGGNQLTWELTVDRPPRWWPWRLGEQPRCDVSVEVRVGGELSDAEHVRTAFRDVRVHQWGLHVNGERMFVMGSNQGPSRMALGEATPEELARDVDLAIAANLDLLRMHAHVSRPELYEAADAAGLLLWQDFPLQWGYGRGVRKAAARQAREMVDLLGHHPSIALWCSHNEPLAVDLQPGEPVTPAQAARVAISMWLPSWNKDVLDRSVTRALRRADPTRFVDPHSGVFPGIGSLGTDSHFYFGWYHGRIDGLAGPLRAWPRLARFISEFGAQAVPDAAGFMEPERWPDLDWDHLLEHHACQRLFFDRVVSPSGFGSFDAWRRATQEYQAALVQLQIEDLRRLTHRPTGGFCHFCFADGHPAVTWSVLDHERNPKLGYAALRDACRDVLPMLDPRTGHVHVASVRRGPLDETEVRVELDGHARRFAGTADPDTVSYVGSVTVEGVTEARLVLTHPDVGEIVNAYTSVFWSAFRDGRLGPSSA